MGTSSSTGGAGGGNPLIPSWIGSGPGSDQGNQGDSPQPSPSPDNPQPGPVPDDNNDNPDGDQQAPAAAPYNDTPQQAVPLSPKRYKQARNDFNSYVKSKGAKSSLFNNALKGYVSKGSGGSSVLSKRMRPSASRIIGFINTFNEIKSSGKTQVLTQLNLSTYQNKPLNEILSALSDEIFKDTGKIYEDTQDDSITKQAYSNTVIRIAEMEGINLDTLTNENIVLMTSVFIEETIAQRVICDIGNRLPKITADISALLKVEENVYQIISGLVRNKILPEITAVQLGSKQNLLNRIENIYRIAFDAIIGSNE